MRRKTNIEFLNEARIIHGNDYEYLGEYKTAHTKITIEHKLCGSVFNMTPSHHIHRRQKCPICAGKRITVEDFIERARLIHGDYYEYSPYINSTTKISMQHKICGLSFLMAPNTHISGRHGCPHCFSNHRKTHEDFVEQANLLHDNKYTYIGRYTSDGTKIDLIHKKCGSKFSVSPNNHLRGRGCPRCMESRGEKLIAKLLDSNGINYERQKTFKGCVGKNGAPYRYDFCINNSVLIEFDGKNHFKMCPRYQRWKGLANTIKRDRNKNHWAIENGKFLYRISYTMLRRDIELFLLDIIKSHALSEEVA